MRPSVRNVFSWLAAIALLIAMGGSSCSDGGATDGPATDGAPAQPAIGVARQAASQAQSTFWVVFKSKADLKAAQAIKDRTARGHHVVNHLKATAQQSQAGVVGLLNAQGITHKRHWITNAIRVTADAQTAQMLEARPEVARIVPDVSYQIPTPIADQGATPTVAGWNISKIRADEVWSTFGTGQGIVIGSIDSGVEYTHDALVGHYRGNLGGSFDHNYNWWDPASVCPLPEPCDNFFHGTHTMGTMVGGDGPGPFPDDIGVAPGAKWIAAKGCESFGCTFESLLSSGEFMLAPTDLSGNNPDPSRRPHIVSNSWGGSSGDPFFRDMVIAWRAAGIFPVFANGNNGPFCGTVGSPGDYPESYGVGATDIDDASAPFSSRGPSFFGVLKPDVSAPGVGVRSSVPGNGYDSFNGTSMATPHVAGAVALIWGAAPSLIGDLDGTANLLRATAVNLIDFQCGGDSDGDPNNVYGEGRIDAFAAVDAAPRIAGTLTGVVTIAGSTQPLAGAAIHAVRHDDGAARTTHTDANGQYAVALAIDSSDGTESYDVDATLFGYIKATAVVGITQNQTTVQDFTLVPAPNFALQGTVRDSAGQPIAFAVVTVQDTPLAPFVTGTDGRYSFPSVPQGDYTVVATERCHDAVTQSVSLGAPVTRDFTLPTHFDAFGYHCESIPLDFVTTTTGLGVAGEGAQKRVPTPFPVPLYGRFFDTAFVSTSGLVNFTGFAFDIFNGTIPDPNPPNGALYGLWDDLFVPGGVRADVYGTAPNRVWIIEYRDAFSFGEFAPATFEIKVKERTGDVEYHYLPTPGGVTGKSATIGIENPEGTVAIQYAFNEPVLRDGLAIRFVPPPSETVTGHVTDGNDGLPITGAKVVALQNGNPVSEVKTGGDGSYRMYLRLGNYTIQAVASRYATLSADVSLGQDDGIVTQDFALQTPRAEVSPTSLEFIVPQGTSRTRTLQITNTGKLAMTWKIDESTGTIATAAAAGTGQWLSQATTGVALQSNHGNDAFAYPSSYAWHPEAGTTAGGILIYEDDIFHSPPFSHLDLALQRLGLPYVAHYSADFGGFEADLAAGGWDLVVFDNQFFFPPDSTLDALHAYAEGGGKLAVTSWTVGGRPLHPLWSTMGIVWISDNFDPPDPVHFWQPSHPAFTTPESVPELTILQSGRFGVTGQRVEPLSGFDALAGYTLAPAANEAALVMGNDRRTVFQGFLDGVNDADRDADGIQDATELWENLVTGLQTGFFVDVPWLSETPLSGSLAVGQSATVQVTVDATSLAPGVYEATLLVVSNSGRTPLLPVHVRAIVPAYQKAVNAGGSLYIDAEGERWSADQQWASGGFGYMNPNPKSKAASISGDIKQTVDDSLYQTYREDPGEYRFDNVPAGVYQIDLRFAEPKNSTKPNQRMFDVIAENNVLLPSHDIASELGSSTADSHVFFVPVTDGQLNLRLVSKKGYFPAILSAVRVTHRPDK